ncbi:Tma64p KNAG_0H03200 [Huiozyma naganishii CBS 8797]|uniref:SUI1 domain-containing protein n=1 Tax=Huiozyma naganishii (strain ATCC MYA-139 / BCRC 22969 / CBS 8797 / KCTC 17520 / NBRC 10181 / NCYC 3082 / Yp74L-3) TaxID=1071383 RepID=J7RA33_HUIN7|nr:hypothetical protein KNAG_0H03200 [Kazachstania naganishii CBS 8797]CCK71735.1 hypothetical protein KNAG_0H03200 [Kazachstania naganishii CBS 8797]
MFKKTPHIKPLSNLKNSEQRKLQQEVQKQFGVDEFVFSGNTVKQTNFQSTTSVGTIYLNDEKIPVPLFFKEKHGSGPLWPSVYACWSHPGLLPIILTHSVVIEDHLFNGANLMISGTMPPFDVAHLHKGRPCGIANYKSPDVIIAVGTLKMDLEPFNTTGVVGHSGVVVEVAHHFADGLADAFRLKLDIPDKLESATTQEVAEEPPVEAKPTSPVTNPVAVDDLAEVLETLSVEDVDYFMTRALYYTLTQEPKLALPINASNFMSMHLMKCLPKGIDATEVNVKKSSWKKTAKYLKHFEKEGLLKLKGKGDDLVVVGSTDSKTHAGLKDFVPYLVGNSIAESGPKSQTTNGPVMFAVTSFQPDSTAQTALPLGGQRYFSGPEIREVLNEYITANKLAQPNNPKMVLLNDTLFGMVTKGNEEKQTTKRIMARPEILERVMKYHFKTLYQLFKDKDTPLTKHPQKGEPPKVHIITEMKIGRKVVTRVYNFDHLNIRDTEFAADLRKLCSASTTIGKTVSTPVVSEIQVQGAHGPLIIDHLRELGVPSSWVVFENKVKPKKKRK